MSDNEWVRTIPATVMENGRMVVGTKVTVAGAFGGLFDLFGPTVRVTHLNPDQLMSVTFRQVGHSLRQAFDGARERFR